MEKASLTDSILFSTKHHDIWKVLIGTLCHVPLKQTAQFFSLHGLVDLMEDLRQVIFARDGGGKFQNLEVEFTIVRLLLF